MGKEITSSLLERAIAREPAAVRELLGLIAPFVQYRIARFLLRRDVAAYASIRREMLELTPPMVVELLATARRMLRDCDPSRGMSPERLVESLSEQQLTAIHMVLHDNPIADTHPTSVQTELTSNICRVKPEGTVANARRSRQRGRVLLTAAVAAVAVVAMGIASGLDLAGAGEREPFIFLRNGTGRSLRR